MKKVMLGGKQVTFRTKISNGKKELARIISENGGWRYGAEWAAQDKNADVTFFVDEPWICDAVWECGSFEAVGGFGVTEKSLKNWHQTILSRAEYFHLYPAPDADGWIEYDGKGSPYSNDVVVEARWTDGDFTCSDNFGPGPAWIVDKNAPNITHHRLHNPEQSKPEFCKSVIRSIPEHEINSKNIALTQVDDIDVVESKQTIEQLAADYRNANGYAERKQQEADAAKADAEAKLKSLELAGEALGLNVSPITAKQEPGLVITDWRDLRVGDIVWVDEYDNRPEGEWPVNQMEAASYVGDYALSVKTGVLCERWISVVKPWRFILRP